MGVDFWDVAQWKEQFAKQDILVMTYQILLNILKAAIIMVTPMILAVSEATVPMIWNILACMHAA